MRISASAFGNFAIGAFCLNDPPFIETGYRCTGRGDQKTTQYSNQVMTEWKAFKIICECLQGCGYLRDQSGRENLPNVTAYIIKTCPSPHVLQSYKRSNPPSIGVDKQCYALAVHPSRFPSFFRMTRQRKLCLT